MKHISVIIIILNIILGIYLGIEINKYNTKQNLLTEDDNKYIEQIKELKQQKTDIEQQISSKKVNLKDIKKQIEEQKKVLDGKAKYIMKINISQTHFTLDLEQHLKDSMNDIDIYIEVSEEFYNKYKVGDTLADDFRIGSLIFKGSFGNWDITVADKQII